MSNLILFETKMMDNRNVKSEKEKHSRESQMTTDVGPAAGQGVVSTQVQQIQADRPVTAERPEPRETVEARPETVESPPPPPPPETGRGTNLDTTA